MAQKDAWGSGPHIQEGDFGVSTALSERAVPGDAVAVIWFYRHSWASRGCEHCLCRGNNPNNCNCDCSWECLAPTHQTKPSEGSLHGKSCTRWVRHFSRERNPQHPLQRCLLCLFLRNNHLLLFVLILTIIAFISQFTKLLLCTFTEPSPLFIIHEFPSPPFLFVLLKRKVD